MSLNQDLVPEDIREFAAAALPLTGLEGVIAIRVVGAGTVTGTLTASAGSARTLTVVDGEVIPGQWLSVDSVATVTRVQIRFKQNGG